MDENTKRELIEGVLTALDLHNIDVAKSFPLLYNAYLTMKEKETDLIKAKIKELENRAKTNTKK